MPTDKIIYAETYRNGAARVRAELLPERLPYMPEGTTLKSMEIRKAGRILIDGQEFEFQDIRVIASSRIVGHKLYTMNTGIVEE